MLYSLLKIPARWALTLYCRIIWINNKSYLNMQGPMLIAANHPNSFLDGIIITSLFKHPVYGLARGDAFAKPRYEKILRALKLLPVYRLREGAENLHNNYDSFARCKEIFKQNGIVLIFSEGLCMNEWKLRPLKKGTARLLRDCWENNIPVTLLPVGINYQSFSSFGKNLRLNFGTLVTEKDIPATKGFGNGLHVINEELEQQLKQLVIESDKTDQDRLREHLGLTIPVWKKIIYAPFALAGFLTHLPLYFPIWLLLQWKAKGSEHYDSIRVALLMLAYPFYLAAVAYIIFLLLHHGILSILLAALFPANLRAYLLLKPQF